VVRRPAIVVAESEISLTRVHGDTQPQGFW
jgi:hypothetical protein